MQKLKSIQAGKHLKAWRLTSDPVKNHKPTKVQIFMCHPQSTLLAFWIRSMCFVLTPKLCPQHFIMVLA